MAVVPFLAQFEAQDGYGWSERYFITLPAVGAGQLAFATAFINARLQILPITADLIRVRFGSSTKRFTTSYLTADVVGSGAGQYDQPANPSEVALELILSGASLGTNRIFLRSIAQIDTFMDNFTPSPGFRTLLNAYAAFLNTNGAFQIQTTATSNPTRNTATNPVPNGARGYVFQTTAAVPPVGSIIRMRGCKIPGYNGLKTVVNTLSGTPNSIIVGGAAPPASDSATGQTWQLITPTTFALTAATAGKLTRRAAGRPFGLIRGRQPTLLPLRQ